MGQMPAFDFDGDGVTETYDAVLAPVLFVPWARQMVAAFAPRSTWTVLDLAAGTGVVTRVLAEQMGEGGKIIAVDVSEEMLSVARQRGVRGRCDVEYRQMAAEALALEDGSVDAVYCQQGFQFFPDKRVAAAEMCRVLREEARAVVTTWLPVDECVFIGLACQTLESCGYDEISQRIRVPFDYMPGQELREAFESAGFSRVEVEVVTQDLVFEQGVEEGVEMIYATPIGPMLRDLGDEEQAAFNAQLAGRLCAYERSGTVVTPMVTHQVVASK